MQLSLLMPKNTTLKPDPERESYTKSFPTIDEAVALSQRLQDVLSKLVGLKYPLDIRKASSLTRREVIDVGEDKNNIQLKGSGRIYFLEFEEIKTGRSAGKHYLRITESRMSAKDGKQHKNSILVFPEDIAKFSEVVAKAKARMTVIDLPYQKKNLIER